MEYKTKQNKNKKRQQGNIKRKSDWTICIRIIRETQRKRENAENLYLWSRAHLKPPSNRWWEHLLEMCAKQAFLLSLFFFVRAFVQSHLQLRFLQCVTKTFHSSLSHYFLSLLLLEILLANTKLLSQQRAYVVVIRLHVILLRDSTHQITTINKPSKRGRLTSPFCLRRDLSRSLRLSQHGTNKNELKEQL